MLTISELVAGYPGKEVLQRLNLHLDSGRIHGLVGLNGSGKTTLLRSISGIMKPFSGTISYSDRKLLPNQVSYLETEPYFYHGITGREYLRLFNVNREVRFDPQQLSELFSLQLDVLIDGYSTGMKKKLGLMAVLMMNRQVILLDEPFNGLDLESARTLSMLLLNWNNPDKVILITSHIIETLKETCSAIHFLNNGIIQNSFTGSDLLDIEKVIFSDIDHQIQEKIEKLRW
jgi:ABC-2 type transport system ATP-binding protein